MGTYTDKLKKALQEFDKVKSDLASIHKCKDEVLALKEQLYDSVKVGHYLRDDVRLILSAPEIIIGNVDHSGILIGEGGSKVTVRGNEVELQGVSSSVSEGSVVTKASSIRQAALNPGKDGAEMVVSGKSEIVSQAVSVSIVSNDVKGTFIEEGSVLSPGVSVVSDTGISLTAVPSIDSISENLQKATSSMDELEKTLSSGISQCKESLDGIIKDLSDYTERTDSLNGSGFDWRRNDAELRDMRHFFKNAENTLCTIVEEYVRLLSVKAENSRRKEAVAAMKKEVEAKSRDFEKKPTGGNITLSTERLSYQSVDGDGRLRQNPEAGLFIRAPHLEMKATDETDALIKDSSVGLNVQHYLLSTADTKKDDNAGKCEISAVGTVSVVSKSVEFQAVDEELKDKKMQEKALTKGSSFRIRAETVSASATDTEGKSVGELNLNAKNIRLASMDVDKEKRTDKDMAQGSQMVLLSEKVFAGSLDKKNKSKLVQVVSDKIGMMADSTAEMQQGESKAVVTLDGGTLTAGADKNELKGDTVINGKADVKGDVTAPKGSFKSVEASSAFKSPNISDGMAVGGGGAAGKPSAKMKMEEVKKQESK